VAGFVQPDAGTIRIGDRDISKLQPEARGLGVVFQSYALFPHYDVFENVAFPLRLRRLPAPEIRKKVTQALEMIDLAALGKRRITQLSGGQQQRVALARAVVFSPPVLLMDEPLGALDRKLREQLQGEIKRIQSELGVTVLYVTHDQEEALTMSDRLAIMRHGRIAQVGSPDEVYARPVSPFAAGFLGESNFLKLKLVSRENDVVKVATAGPEPRVMHGAVVNGAATANELVGMVRPEAIRIGQPRSSEENSLVGALRRRELLGPSVRLTVDCGFAEFVVRVPRLDGPDTLEHGGRIELTWRAQDMLLFPDTETADGEKSW
jgi:ABC-type Fe3+/spermidine/putrescine transport system ATPase subunit